MRREHVMDIEKLGGAEGDADQADMSLSKEGK
jgi:hypothetical protein